MTWWLVTVLMIGTPQERHVESEMGNRALCEFTAERTGQWLRQQGVAHTVRCEAR